jgi:hypothetical protein
MVLLIYVQKKGARCDDQRKAAPAATTNKKPRVSAPLPADTADNASPNQLWAILAL